METYCLLAASDLVWQAAIAGVVTIALAWIATRTSKKLDEIKATGESTHKLSNSAMSAQLTLTADLSEWKAKQTGLAIDIESAAQARRQLFQHLNAQAVVDATPKA